MKRKLRLLLAVVLAMTMFMGLSITSFAATVALQNPKTIGVQLIDDTLIIQEDHHNFFVWGKSVMIQCPGVTDILPNNVTDMMDIQFDGNLYKGIKEVIIVSSPEKNDKVHLEEGSMIITGVTTLKQIQNIKTAMLSRPNTLVELKSVLTGASKYLSTTKNYIIGKNNEVLNETGSRVAKKELQGTAELVTDEDVVHAVVEEATSSDSESEPVEAKKDPTPTPTPTPTRCEHQYVVDSHNYVKCIKCGTANPECNGCNHNWDAFGKCTKCNHECYHNYVNLGTGHQCSVCGIGDYHHYDFENVSKHKCTDCGAEDNHRYNDGRCNMCYHNCQHTGESAGETCRYCGMTVPSVCSVDHSTFCSGKNCDECGEPGTKRHAWNNGVCRECETHCTHDYNYVSDEDHKCTVCGKEDSHVYDNDGYCSICMHNCQHTGQTVGQTCEFCNITVPCSMDHTQLCPGKNCNKCGAQGTGSHIWGYFNSESHRCNYCGGEDEHVWTDGHCNICDTDCPVCNGEGDSEDGCENCGYFPDGPCPVPETHGSLHEGQQCDGCPYVGEAPHTWEPAGSNNHKCSSCIDVYEAHAWEDGVCTICHYTCNHPGQQEDVCSYCGISLASPTPCQVDHSTICSATTCVCGAQGTGGHTYTDVDANDFHKCSGCGHNASHEYEQGVCSVCNHHCTHSGYSAGQQCQKCWIIVP